MGGVKPHRSKRYSEVQSSRSFVETVKGPVQARDMKHSQQPFIREKEKDRMVEKKAEPSRDKPCTQVVVFETQAKTRRK